MSGRRRSRGERRSCVPSRRLRRRPRRGWSSATSRPAPRTRRSTAGSSIASCYRGSRHVLGDITPAVVRSWYSGLDPKHPTQRTHVYSLLRAILNEAVRDEIITRNPYNIRSASVTKRQVTIDPATPAEIEALMAEMPQRYHAFVLIGAWCGRRFGQMSELRRRDIDLVSGVIHVRRAVVWDGGDPFVGPPKNGLGRSVTMPPHMVELVAVHIEKFAAPGPDGLLFHAIKDPSRQVGSNTARRHWIKGSPTLSGVS